MNIYSERENNKIDDYKSIININCLLTKDLNMMAKALTGRQFNEKYKGHTFVKLTNKSEIHNGFQFQTGLNIDRVPSNKINVQKSVFDSWSSNQSQIQQMVFIFVKLIN